jgi:hypothetical protein
MTIRLKGKNDDQMDRYFGRQDDKAQLRAKMIQRYGIVIETTDDEDGTKRQTYKRGDFADRVNLGMEGEIGSGFGPKIVNALATLFTEKGMKFEYTREGEASAKKGAALLEEYREKSGFLEQLAKADRKSVQLASSAFLVSFWSNQFDYKVLTKADVLPVWGDTIIDEGDSGEDGAIKGKERGVDRSDINDAFCVIIRLSKSELGDSEFLAIFGRNEDYPNGRWVTYKAATATDQIPPVGSKEANDFVMGENKEIANPLSWYAAHNPAIEVKEYPLVIFDGCIAESDDVMTVSESLYNDCLEMDLAASHLLCTSQDAARGTTAISDEKQEAEGRDLPQSIHGATYLGYGRKLEHVSHDSAASKDGLDVLDRLMINNASGYGVPDYMVVSKDYTLDASSGIALEVKSRPLKRKRNEREKENSQAVKDLFDIERYYLEMFAAEDADPGALTELLDCEQRWTAGPLILPENKKEKIERIEKAMDKGIVDQIEGIRDYYNLSSEAEAIEHYERMKERQAKYPPLGPKEKTKPAPGLKKAFGNGTI